MCNSWWIRQLPMPNGSWEEGLLLLITLLNITFFYKVITTEKKSLKDSKWETISVALLIPFISYIFIADSDWSILETISYLLFIVYCIVEVGYRLLQQPK